MIDFDYINYITQTITINKYWNY